MEKQYYLRKSDRQKYFLILDMTFLDFLSSFAWQHHLFTPFFYFPCSHEIQYVTWRYRGALFLTYIYDLEPQNTIFV